MYQVFKSQWKIIKFGLSEGGVQPCSRLSVTCTAEYAGADVCRVKKDAALFGFKRLISFPEIQEAYFTTEAENISRANYLCNNTPTRVHIADGVKSVDATADDAVLSVQHPVPPPTSVLAPGLLMGRRLEVLSISVNCCPSFGPGSELHAEFDEAAHKLSLVNK